MFEVEIADQIDHNARDARSADTEIDPKGANRKPGRAKKRRKTKGFTAFLYIKVAISG